MPGYIALRRSLPITVALALAACGGGGSGGTSDASATPSLGLIRQAEVNFYRADDPACPLACELLGSANTGTTGIISARFSDYSGPMVIEVVGGGSAEYFDEQTGQFEPFSGGDRIHALAPSSRGRFAVTVLTELAYQRAVAEDRFPLTSTVVNSLNNEIGAALAPEITSGILTPPGLISDTTVAGSLLNNTPNLYALKLAAFAALGNGGSPTPALATLNALIEDVQDGTIDGLNDGAPLVPAAPYNPATFAADLQAAMESFAADYADSNLQSRVGALNQPLSLALFDNPNDGGGDGGDGGDGGSGTLGDASGITGTFGGTVRTSTDVTDFRGPPVSVALGILDVGGPLDPFSVNLRQFGTSIGTPQNCASNGVPSLFVVIDGISYSGTPFDGNGASCTITVTEVTGTAIRGTFSGNLTASEQPDLVVTNGEFQYLIEPFAAGNGSAQVAASFEGLEVGTLNGQSNGVGDAGWQGTWTDSLTIANVVDVSAGPLAFTPASGSELSGGDQALQFSSFSAYSLDGRQFANAFVDDIYVGFLVRVADASQPARSRITLGNPAVYIGLDSNDGSNQFVVSLTDNEANRARAGGTLSSNTSYLVVGRLYKDQPTDDDYNRLSLWVDPGVNDSSSPDATAQRTRGTGSILALDRIGLAGDSQFSNLQLDRIRVSDSWEGIFGAVVEEPVEEETGTCGGEPEGTSELPAGNDLIATCAGTYEVTQVLGGSHSRMTVTIGGDNSIDFDSGVSFPAGDITSTFNRISAGDRIEVNYSNGDKIQLFRTRNGVLRHVTWQPFEGEEVAVSTLAPLPASTRDGSALLGNLIIGTLNDEVRQESNPELTNSGFGPDNVFSLGSTNFGSQWSLQRIPSQEGTYYCQPRSFGVQILHKPDVDNGDQQANNGQAGGVFDQVGRCTVTVTSVTRTGTPGLETTAEVEGTFSVELLSNVFLKGREPVGTVLNGFFRYQAP